METYDNAELVPTGLFTQEDMSMLYAMRVRYTLEGLLPEAAFNSEIMWMAAAHHTRRLGVALIHCAPRLSLKALMALTEG